jgi:hypothetical protein
MCRCPGESHADLHEPQYRNRQELFGMKDGDMGLLEMAMRKHGVHNASWEAFLNEDSKLTAQQLKLRLVRRQGTGNFYSGFCRCSRALAEGPRAGNQPTQAEIGRLVSYLRLFGPEHTWGHSGHKGALEFVWNRKGELKINAEISLVVELCKAVLADDPDASKVKEFRAFADITTLFTYEAHRHLEHAIVNCGLAGRFDGPEQELYKAAFDQVQSAGD